MFEELEEQFGFTQQELEGFHEHFRKIDTGLDGHITHDDLRIKFKAMNVRVSPKILNDLIREVDTNRNGQVEFEEFVRLMYRLKKGGTSNWTQLLEFTRPKPKDIARKAANATLRYLGAVPAFEFSEQEEWQNYSYFDRKDVKKNKGFFDKSKNPKGKGKSKDIELKNVKVDDEEAEEIDSDSSFEFYSDDENKRDSRIPPPISKPGPSSSQNLQPGLQGNGHVRSSSPKHIEGMNRLQAKLEKEEQMVKRVSKTEAEMNHLHPSHLQKQASRPKIETNFGPSSSPSSSSPIPKSPIKSSPVEENVRMRVPKQFSKDSRPLSSDFEEVNVQQRMSIIEQQKELDRYAQKRREEEESLQAAILLQQQMAEESWSVVGDRSSQLSTVPLTQEPRAVRSPLPYPIAESFGDITHEVARSVPQSTPSDQLIQLQEPERRPKQPRNPSATKRRKTIREQPQRRKTQTARNDGKKKKAHDAVLQDPKVRHQLAKLTDHKPYFISLVVIIEVIVMVYMIIINGGFESFMINPLGGPKTRVVIQTGALYVPCMREATGSQLEKFSIKTIEDPVTCPYGYEGSYLNTTGVCTYYDVQDWLCGMGGFHGGIPNQWWRFLTASFVHMGAIHLVIIVIFQFWFVFNLERDIGSIRTGFIFILSSVLGYAFAGNMSPLQLGAGASPSLFAFMSILYIDLFQNWPLIATPWKNLGFLVLSTFIALAIGLLPYIDNYAHMGAFVGGVLSGLVFMPTITFGKWDGRTKKILLVVALLILIALYVAAFIPFYDHKETDYCRYCEYLNCVPPGASWCALSF